MNQPYILFYYNLSNTVVYCKCFFLHPLSLPLIGSASTVLVTHCVGPITWALGELVTQQMQLEFHLVLACSS